MASNKELSEEILKLDPNAAVDGLSNPKLEALLAGLKTPPSGNPPPAPANSEAERAAKIKADSEMAAKAQADANAAGQRAVEGNTGYKVAPGKALTTLRGVISGDDPEFTGGGRLSATDFHMGEADLNRHVESGFIVKS
jgi:hypothetical protein